MHASQLVDLEMLAWYPRGQFLHFPRPAPVAGENEPGTQFLHPGLEVVPGLSEYFPPPHRLQVEANVAPEVSPYVPLGHLSHLNLPRVSENSP